MEQIALIVGVILAIYGLMDLIERLAFWVLFPKGERGYRVIPLAGRCDGVEYIARRIEAERRLHAFKNDPVLLVDCGLEEESRRLALRVCEQLQLRFCEGEKFGEMLTAGLQEKENVL